MLTDPDTHIDFGFGLLASNFYNTAEFLWEKNPSKNTTGILPNLYLYRHSIELYLKSLIVIIHKKLQLDYKDGEVSYDSNEPLILISKKEWRKISNCHYISALYGYFETLITEHENRLQEKASQKLSKIIDPENLKLVKHIQSYDDSSTYFRYSNLKNPKTDKKEKEKHQVRKVEVEDLENEIEIDKPSSFLLIVNPDSEEIIEAHKGSREMPLNELSKDLKQFAEYLSGIHAMFRITLCHGY